MTDKKMKYLHEENIYGVYTKQKYLKANFMLPLNDKSINKQNKEIILHTSVTRVIQGIEGMEYCPVSMNFNLIPYLPSRLTAQMGKL